MAVLEPYGGLHGGATIRDCGTFSILKSRRAVNDFGLIDSMPSVATSLDIAESTGNT